MVKRILALSLLMVGLVACGSGGGASAEADTVNATPEPTCQCSVTHIADNTVPFTSPAKNASGDMCNSENLYLSFGCANFAALCTLILKDWGINNDGGAATLEYNLSNLWVSCK